MGKKILFADFIILSVNCYIIQYLNLNDQNVLFINNNWLDLFINNANLLFINNNWLLFIDNQFLTFVVGNLV